MESKGPGFESGLDKNYFSFSLFLPFFAPVTIKLRKLKKTWKKRKKENNILSIGKCKNHKIHCCI